MQTFVLSSFLLALAGLTSVSAVPHSFRGEHVKIAARQNTGNPSSAVAPLTPITTEEGRPLLIQWETTSNPKWSSMEIKFMTGSNQDMTELATVATGVDGTASGTGVLNWTAPAVEPNSRIYFFQFTHGGQDPTWTTRFAIADEQGQTTPPPQANQPEGGSPAIPWGLGALEGSASTASTVSGASASLTSSSSSSPSPSSSSSSASSIPTQQTATTSSSSISSTTASASTSSTGIDYSRFNSGNQPSSASSSVKVVSAAVIGGSILAGMGALLL